MHCLRPAARLGAVMVMVTLWIFVLLAFAGLAIGVGELCAAKQHAQDAADAAVMAGASAWRPYMYDPATSDWRDRYGNSAAPADTLEMSGIIAENDYNSALDLGDLDLNGTPVRPPCLGSRMVSVQVTAAVPCTTNVLFYGFFRGSSSVVVSANGSAEVRAEVFPWMVDNLPGRGRFVLRINQRGTFPLGGWGIFTAGIPAGADPESPLSAWKDRLIPPDVNPSDGSWRWTAFDQGILDWMAANTGCFVRLPTRQFNVDPKVSTICLGSETLRIDSVGTDESGKYVRCTVQPEVGQAYFSERHWRWSYRLKP